MSCCLEAPCGGKARLIAVMPTHTVFQCFGSAHTLLVGEPPKWASRYYEASNTRETKLCGYNGCRGYVKPDRTRCYRHRGKGRGEVRSERRCLGCRAVLPPASHSAKLYCDNCNAREREARAREAALRVGGARGKQYLCLECDSPGHLTRDCPIEKASRV